MRLSNSLKGIASRTDTVYICSKLEKMEKKSRNRPSKMLVCLSSKRNETRLTSFPPFLQKTCLLVRVRLFCVCVFVCVYVCVCVRVSAFSCACGPAEGEKQ